MKSLLDDRRSANAGAALGKGESSIPNLLKDVTDAFEGSFEGIERVTETVRAMKEFAHPGDAEKSATDLNDAIRTTLIVARNEYKHVADIDTQFGEIPSIDCRRAEINKVLLNLIVNAAHAIESAASNRPGKGTITLTTASDATHVVVTIADTGCGIPRAVISRIFDPFFTTKPVGKGTGQGLAIARSIVDNHNGRLEVESTVGVGTTFIIRLPLTTVELKSPSALAVADAETIG
jgi:signal transduction histidine kinase